MNISAKVDAGLSNIRANPKHSNHTSFEPIPVGVKRSTPLAAKSMEQAAHDLLSGVTVRCFAHHGWPGNRLGRE